MTVEELTGQNGTGGLLVIYANNINNTGSIQANGKNGGFSAGAVSGGSSGGGSINIFYKNAINQKGTIESNGGEKVGTTGSKGGNGSISIGNISTGSYVSTFKNY